MHCSSATIDLQAIRDVIAAADAAGFRFVNLGLAARWLDPVMIVVTTLGLGWVQAALGLGTVIAGFVTRKADLRRVGYAVLVACTGAFVLSQAAKHLWDRPRPVLLLFDARLPAGPLFVHSFPSGHATTAFAVAFVWAAFAAKARWRFYALAALVALSRVYLGVHFPFDVLYGAFLGSLIGIGAARLFRLKPGLSPATTEAAE
jgi:undecaprenyl-diphosphatase